MAISDARKRANQRWDARNMHNFTVKMSNREAAALMAAAAAAGVSVHSVFLAAAREYIRAHAPTPDASSVQQSGVGDDGDEAATLGEPVDADGPSTD